MTVEYIKIEGLKGFAEEQTLNLAQPNGKIGSGITMIVGANNRGKSTIIEAFNNIMSKNISYTESSRNCNTKSRVKLSIKSSKNDNKIVLTTVENGGCETILSVSINDSIYEELSKTILIISSSKFFGPFFSRTEMARTSYTRYLQIPKPRNTGINEFIGRLFEIHKDSNRRKKFNTMLSRVLNSAPDWIIELSDQNQYYIKFSFGNNNHNSDGLGEGLMKLFIIIDALYDADPGDTIIIDEPDSSLHPSILRKLVKLFCDQAKDKQIIYATHSPYFIDFEAIANGAQVARVYQKNYECKIAQLSTECIVNLTKLLGDKHNPHTLGLNAREVFFLEDKIILVEGQEDVVFYPIIADELSMTFRGDFFGWGVGGADKMEIIAKILDDLKYEKVVGILDNNRRDKIPSLNARFKNFKFITIPADDIRTKSSKPAAQKEGLLDEDNKLKQPYKNDIENIINEVNNYFE